MDCKNFLPQFSEDKILLFSTKQYYFLTRYLHGIYEKLTQIKYFVNQKINDDIDGITDKEKINEIKDKLIQERMLYVIGVLFSVLKTPKDVYLYECTLIQLLGPEA